MLYCCYYTIDLIRASLFMNCNIGYLPFGRGNFVPLYIYLNVASFTFASSKPYLIISLI
jgi:hypothetical protein